MQKPLLLLGLLFASHSPLADQPFNAPESYRVCNIFVTACSYSQIGGDTTVYKVSGDFELRKLYDIQGWHRGVEISPNGETIVIPYQGLNLLPLDVHLDQPILTVFKQGKITMVVRLGDIFSSLSDLSRTASHYDWGYIDFLSDQYIDLETPQGHIRVDY